MTRSKVIGGQIVTVIWRQIVIVMVALFQIAPAWTGSLRLQPNLDHRCTMGTFTLWRTSRSHDKVKGHWRSKVIGGQIVTVIWCQIVIVMVALFQIAPAWTGSLRLQPNLNHRCVMTHFEVTWQGQISLQVNFTKISINILSEKLLVMVLLHVTF